MVDSQNEPSRQDVLSAAVTRCKKVFVGVGIVSGVINILMLTGAFFMLQVYDRVIPSGSVPTLVGLGLLAAGLYLFQGMLDAIRGRVLTRIGGALDEALGQHAYDIVIQLPLKMRVDGDGLQISRDLDQVRQYLSGLGPTAFFDMPWVPLYLGICFLFHPIIGLVASGGAALLFVLAIMTDVLSKKPARDASQALLRRNALAATGQRNAEVVRAMGLGDRIGARWAEANTHHLAAQQSASDVTVGLGALSKMLRMILQSGILALGAWLVINQQATAGIMIASSIMMSRALAPVELAIANWRGFVAARSSWSRLTDLMTKLPADLSPMELPEPKDTLNVEGVSVGFPGGRTATVQNISFALKSGDGLGIIGPSASGKSTLARALVGVWRPVRGTVRLDGAALDQWFSQSLGNHIGYLPQDVELFSGTVAQNIARLESSPNSEAVVDAARAAGVHETILRLPDGYETEIGDGGNALSAGQRQRIALARALYKDPFLVVLDEPNSNLDAEGDVALTSAIHSVRSRGGIVIVVAHRPSALSSVDLVLAMAAGQTQKFGKKEEVLGSILRKPSPSKPQPGQAQMLNQLGAKG